MKKIISIIAILLITGLVFGCKAQSAGKEETPDDTTDVFVEPVTPGPIEEETAKPGSVTQEDLDKLKSSIESLEAEDLGGLSE